MYIVYDKLNPINESTSAVNMAEVHEIIENARRSFIVHYGTQHLDIFDARITYSRKWVYRARMNWPLIALALAIVLLLAID